ncbi:MAG TPA: tryptophan 7-halogenase [Abditibacteriaceae bacterium]
MVKKFDLAIVGSGFAGSLLAMIAHRLGYSVVLLEKSRHPRFAIGESSTPLANLLLEELSTRYDLPRLLPLSKWGSWQRHYPKIACGLKRGFSFFHHHYGQPFTDDAQRSNQLLLAASPHNEIADTHWYRPDFDHFFVREAQSLGVEYWDEVALQNMCLRDDGVLLNGVRHGEPVSVRARFVVDATGPRGFIHQKSGLQEKPLEHLPGTQALYSHFTGVKRLDEMGIYSEHEPPYLVDDAAVHHVFDGGWIWVLRFNNGITSAGVAATDALAEELQFEDGAAAWDRLLKKLPTVHEQFSDAAPQMPFVHAKRLAFQSETVVGKRWALLPSAAGFIDPLLSTGFPLTLLGVARLAEVMEHDWESCEFATRLKTYEAQTHAELNATERLIAALYSCMSDFSLFVPMSMLYFTAATYTETARRLDRSHLAGLFLMHNHPVFGPALAACCEKASQWSNATASPVQKQQFVAQIMRTIEPFNVAGLGRPHLRNWYPVDASDLLDAAPKLSANRQEIEQLLARCGF